MKLALAKSTQKKTPPSPPAKKAATPAKAAPKKV
jgi:hypothetical protein